MNKDKIAIFGANNLPQIITEYNEWSNRYDNIEVMEVSFIPIRERRTSKTYKMDGSESAEEVIDTDYNLVVHYMITDETHIKRVNKGAGTGVT